MKGHRERWSDVEFLFRLCTFSLVGSRSRQQKVVEKMLFAQRSSSSLTLPFLALLEQPKQRKGHQIVFCVMSLLAVAVAASRLFLTMNSLRSLEQEDCSLTARSYHELLPPLLTSSGGGCLFAVVQHALASAAFALD